MLLLALRVIGNIILVLLVTGIWVRHKRKNTPIIKYKAKTETQKEKQKVYEKRLDIACTIGLVVCWLVLAVPSILDLPFLLTNNVREVSGIVISGDTANENQIEKRTVTIKDDTSKKEIMVNLYDEAVDEGAALTVCFLPCSKKGYIIER